MQKQKNAQNRNILESRERKPDPRSLCPILSMMEQSIAISQVRLGGVMTIVLKSRCVHAALLFALFSGLAQCGAQSVKYNDSYTVQGFSQPARISAVASPVPGIVDSLAVREGQSVARGECLLKLDDSVQHTKVELARVAKDSQGELKTAQAELRANLTRLERIEALATRKHATSVELLQAEELVAISRASVQRATDRLAQQEADYARLLAESARFTITAPFAGVVVEFAKEAGEYVGPGDAAVCTLADLNTLVVEFLVPGQYRHNLDVDDEVNVFFTIAKREVPGQIRFISPYPNGETNTYTVKVRVDNRDGELKAGERCQLEGLNEFQESFDIRQATNVTMRN